MKSIVGYNELLSIQGQYGSFLVLVSWAQGPGGKPLAREAKPVGGTFLSKGKDVHKAEPSSLLASLLTYVVGAESLFLDSACNESIPDC